VGKAFPDCDEIFLPSCELEEAETPTTTFFFFFIVREFLWLREGCASFPFRECGWTAIFLFPSPSRKAGLLLFLTGHLSSEEGRSFLPLEKVLFPFLLLFPFFSTSVPLPSAGGLPLRMNPAFGYRRRIPFLSFPFFVFFFLSKRLCFLFLVYVERILEPPLTPDYCTLPFLSSSIFPNFCAGFPGNGSSFFSPILMGGCVFLARL